MNRKSTAHTANRLKYALLKDCRRLRRWTLDSLLSLNTISRLSNGCSGSREKWFSTKWSLLVSKTKPTMREKAVNTLRARQAMLKVDLFSFHKWSAVQSRSTATLPEPACNLVVHCCGTKMERRLPARQE